MLWHDCARVGACREDYRAGVTSPPRSQADDIRGRSDDELVALLLARPDLGRPAPTDLTSLAARVGTRASTQRAVDSLDRAHLSTLEAVAVAPADATAATVADLLGAPEAQVAPLLADLWRHALVWGSPQQPHASRTVLEVLGPYAADLGPSAPHLPLVLAGPAAVRERAAQAPPPAQAVLDRLVAGPPVATAASGSGAAAAGVRWLAEHDLVLVGEDGQVILPREVGIALRAGHSHVQPDLLPPSVTGTTLSAALVDAAAGARITELLDRLDELVDAWGARPPRVLRAGGLAVRDLAALARRLDLPPADAALVAELAVGAGLVADDGEVHPAWSPTAAYDDDVTRPAAQRWARLVTGWWGSTRAAHLVGRTLPAGVVNALGPEVPWPPIRSLRHDILQVVADQPGGPDGGRVAPTAQAIEQQLRWRRPRRLPRDRGDLHEVVAAVLHEADVLGVLGHGALSTAGQALVDSARPEPDALAQAVAPLLPEPVDRVILQGDLTAVAPGPLAGDLATFVKAVADVESRGGGTVYRFSEGSVRRALDAGWDADLVLDRLAAASITPVPQPLDYLVRDTARRHGAVRVGAAGGYLRSDDTSLLEEIVSARATAVLGLRRIAPTVVVSRADPATLLEVLREAGYAPVAESSGGAVVHAVARPRRVDRRGREAEVASRVPSLADAQALVSAMRTGEDTVRQRRDRAAAAGQPELALTDPTATIALVRDAIAERSPVWVAHVDRFGETERLLLVPERIEGGRVQGTVEGRPRSLSVHRISGAGPA